MAAAAIHLNDYERLLGAVKELSYLTSLEGVIEVVRKAARELVDADGVTFVLREGDKVHYVDENAIGPLWKGKKFPISACISGWAILNRSSVAITDIYEDGRIPHNAYRATFVRSLLVTPIRKEEPIGAIGAYWATEHVATVREQELLESLAASTSIALRNAELYRDCQQAIRARDEFLGIASHELRTPLSALLLRLRTMKKNVAPGGSVDIDPSDLGKVEHSAQRLTRLIDSLFDASRLMLGTLPLTPSNTDLVDIAKLAVEENRNDAERAGCCVNVHNDGPVAGCWDALRTAQLISNLLSNAIKFGEGRPIELSISGDASSGIIQVTDRGRGISLEDQQRIFEKFERAVSSRHVGGLGLGLWLARQISEAHGGRIEVESRPGLGSRFCVRLPRGLTEDVSVQVPDQLPLLS